MKKISIDMIKNDVKAGKPIVIVDDKDRENEGDLVIAADMANVENLVFLMNHAKGLMCLAHSEQAFSHLDVPMMVENSSCKLGTPFTVSIDAAEGISTGMSVYDRLQTIKVCLDPNSKPQDLARPGHLFPLRAKPKLLKERRGHTESAVELMKLCGLSEVAIIMEIMNDDGTMTKDEQLVEYSQKFGLNMISVQEIYDAVYIS